VVNFSSAEAVVGDGSDSDNKVLGACAAQERKKNIGRRIIDFIKNSITKLQLATSIKPFRDALQSFSSYSEWGLDFKWQQLVGQGQCGISAFIGYTFC
jgi:hypothetical protein